MVIVQRIPDQSVNLMILAIDKLSTSQDISKESVVSGFESDLITKAQHQAPIDNTDSTHDSEEIIYLEDKYRSSDKLIFEGANGKIIKGYEKTTRKDIIIKIIKNNNNQAYETAIKNEFELLQRLNHKNIMRITSLVNQRSQPELAFIMPFYEHGDLLQFLSDFRRCKKEINSNLKDSIFKQIVKGVNYLHTNNIAHRDLKPENFLITNDGTVKIGDFGYYVDLESLQADPQTFWNLNNQYLVCGTNSFKAPEIFRCETIFNETKNIDQIKSLIDFKALDCWSLGILYIQIYLMKKPWNIATLQDHNYRAFKEEYPGYDKLIFSLCKELDDSKCSNSKLNPCLCVFRDLHYESRFYIFKLLNPTNTKRLTVSELLKSDWMNQIYANPNELIILRKSINV